MIRSFLRWVAHRWEMHLVGFPFFTGWPPAFVRSYQHRWSLREMGMPFFGGPHPIHYVPLTEDADGRTSCGLNRPGERRFNSSSIPHTITCLECLEAIPPHEFGAHR